MANAAKSRSDIASRSDDDRPKLEDFCIPEVAGMRPFVHLNEPSFALEQAFSLLQLLRHAWVADGPRAGEDGLSAINNTMHAAALEGIAMLVALGAHGVEVLRHDMRKGW